MVESLHMTSLQTLTPTLKAASLTSEGKPEEDRVVVAMVDVGVASIAGPGIPLTKMV